MSLDFDPKNSPDFDSANLQAVLPDLSREQLFDIIVQQAALIHQLQIKVAQLEFEIDRLNQQPPSSTAPFRIPDHKHVAKRKKPGQKKGHKGHFRQRPTPTEVIEVPLDFCPDCFSPIEAKKNHTQTIEELPLLIAQVFQIKTQSGFCKTCKKKVRSSHPLLFSKAKGAASTSIGPQAAALAIELQHRFHLTKSKTCAILQELFGIKLSRGGLVSLSHRLADKLQAAFAALQGQVQQATHIHADETGWYVGQPGYSLCVFTNKLLTLYHITKSRSRDMVKTLLGDYQGVLISDCLSIYDEVNVHQQKCYAHHLKALTQAFKKIPSGDSAYLSEVKLMLETAMVLKRMQEELSLQESQQRLQQLERWADNLLLAEKRKEPLQPEEETVRQRLFKQRDHLFEFLKHPEVEATNNQAERQLRPAVIARKVSCGNRTEKGARTWEVLASLAVTTHQRKQSFKDLISTSMYGLPP